MTLKEKPYENNVGKGENAGDQHFLLFLAMFSNLSEKEIIILATITCNLSSANSLNLVNSKYLSSDKELNTFCRSMSVV